MFGIGNSELKAAKEQRQIEKLRNKSAKEEAKVERYKTNTEIQAKNGGRGISAGMHYADKTKLDDTPKKGSPVKASRQDKPKAPAKALNGKRK